MHSRRTTATVHELSHASMRALQLSLVAVWLITAVASVWDATLQQSLGRLWLYDGGLTDPTWQTAVIGAGVAWDVAAGLGLLLAHRHRWIYAAALIGTVAMTLIATWIAPEQWLHPMGPLFKNIVIWAALWALYKATRPTSASIY